MRFQDVERLPERDRTGVSLILDEPFSADHFGTDPTKALGRLLSFKRLAVHAS